MRLLEPLTLGPRRARNRVVFGPHETNLARRRAISDRHVAYYRRRAAGGVGVVVVETASVTEEDWPYERCPLVAASGEGLAAVGAACHAEGALVLASLGHAGGQGSSAYSQQPLLAPSRFPEVTTREVPKAMEPGDIASVVEGFGRATRAALDAGLDGVEVDAGPYSLVRQFLSGLTNHREDAFGTDRLRFAKEVLDAVRAEADGAVVGLRLCTDELAPWAGIVPEDAVATALGLADWLDYVTVVRGSVYSPHAHRPDGRTEQAFNAHAAAALRRALPERVAVVLQGSVVDPEVAERALAERVADAVEMTRAQIADPDLVEKLARGEAHRIRPCILCNQACAVRDARNPIVSCVGEPAAGHELDEPWLDTDRARREPNAPRSFAATRPRRREVLVVGGGPAGLECARVAAALGHHVRLAEASEAFGGALLVAAAAPGRARLAKLVSFLEAECERHGVLLEPAHEVGAEEVLEAAAKGRVVLCTGSRRGPLPCETEEGASVEDAASVLKAAARGGELPRGPVVVWDPIGGPIGVSVAELVAGAGLQTALVTPDLVVGSELARSGDLPEANRRLHRLGVTLVRRSLLRRVEPGAVVVEDRFSGARERLAAATLVDAGHRLPEDRLFSATGRRLPRAGDALAPRTVLEAVLEGRRAALALEDDDG